MLTPPAVVNRTGVLGAWRQLKEGQSLTLSLELASLDTTSLTVRHAGSAQTITVTVVKNNGGGNCLQVLIHLLSTHRLLF